MPEEHEGQLGFNYLWKELIHRTEAAGNYSLSFTFWRPLLRGPLGINLRIC